MKSACLPWMLVWAFGLPVPIGLFSACEFATAQTAFEDQNRGIGVRRISARPVRGVGHHRDEGTVAILMNGSVMEGKITRTGSRYRIEFQLGEMQIPIEQVKYVCHDWAEAHDIMQSRANLRDPDERFRLASWCYQYRLYDRAVEEAKAGLRLRPNHPPTRQLIRMVQQAKLLAQQAATHKQVSSVVPPTPELDLNAESMRLFTTGVQPVLMNACAKCHTGHNGGSFRLYRNHGSGLRSRRATRHNLNVVIAHLNLERPELSPLLIKSVSRHSRNLATEPIKSRKAEPYKRLKEWVQYVIENNPHLPSRLAQKQQVPTPQDVQRIANVTPSSRPNTSHQTDAIRPQGLSNPGSSFGMRGTSGHEPQRPTGGQDVLRGAPARPQGPPSSPSQNTFAATQAKEQNVSELFPKQPTPPSPGPSPQPIPKDVPRQVRQPMTNQKPLPASGVASSPATELAKPPATVHNAYDPRQWNLRMHPRVRQRPAQSRGGR